jgi:hypothetical protein
VATCAAALAALAARTGIDHPAPCTVPILP